MSTFLRNFFVGCTTLLLVSIGAFGCGGTGSNNDQGTSFLAFGWFTLTEDGEDIPDDLVGVSGLFVPLNSDRPLLSTAGGAADGLTAFVFMGLENRLTNQFIRVNRVDCEYNVQGSSVSIPSDSYSTGVVLGGRNEEAPDGTDPFGDDALVRPQAAFISVPALSTDVYSFLNVNQSSLPATPYTLTAICTAQGITQGGDVITTNELTLPITVLENAECCTGVGAQGQGGFQQGVGSGGTIPVTEDSGTSGSLTGDSE